MDNTNYIKIGSPEYFILKCRITFLKKMKVAEPNIKEMLSIKYSLPKVTFNKLFNKHKQTYRAKMYEAYQKQITQMPTWKEWNRQYLTTPSTHNDFTDIITNGPSFKEVTTKGIRGIHPSSIFIDDLS